MATITAAAGPWNVNSKSSATTATVVSSAYTPAVGDVAFCNVSLKSNTAVTTPSFTGWTTVSLGSKVNGTAVGMTLFLLICTNASTAVTSWAFSWTASAAYCIDVGILQGVDVTSPSSMAYVVGAGATGASTSVAPGSLTPKWDSAMVISCGTNIANATLSSGPSAGTSWWNTFNSGTSSTGLRSLAAYNIESGSPAAYAPTWTLSASETWCGMTVWLKPDSNAHYVGSGAALTGGAVSSVNHAFGVAVPVGSSVCVGVLIYAGGSTVFSDLSSITDTGSNSYTSVGWQTDSGNYTAHFWICKGTTTALTTSDTFTVTFAGASADYMISVDVFDSPNTDTSTTSNAGTAASITGTSVTLSSGQAADLIFTGFIGSANHTMAVTSTDYTQVYSLNQLSTNDMMGGLIAPQAAGTFHIAGTQASPAFGNMSFAVAFAPAASGPTTVLVTDASTSATDVPAVTATVPLSDASSSTSETLSASVTAPLSDSGIGSDTPTASVTLNVPDSGTGTDIPGFAPLLSDSAAGSDSVSIAPVTPAVNNAGSGTDVFAVIPKPALNESGAGSDSLAINASFSLNDGGTTHGVMPRISTGQPVYTTPGSYPSADAADRLWTTHGMWHNVNAVSVGSPGYVAFDLSGVASGRRGNIVFAWHNQLQDFYNSAAFSGCPKDFTVDVNTAAGGTLPTTGWVTLKTVTSNLLNAAMYQLNMTGYNWIRINITASNDTSGDVSFALVEVFDASSSHDDTILVLGDSITREAWGFYNIDNSAWDSDYGPIVDRVTLRAPTYTPLMIDGGVGGSTISYADTNFTALTSGFTGKYCVIAYGTNDVNVGFVWNSTNISTYYTSLLSVIDKAIAAGFIPIVPYIMYGTNNGGDLGTNAQLVNNYVNTNLPIDRPTVIRGPDLWTPFFNNTALIRDGIHPTYQQITGPSGYDLYHQVWADWLLDNLYSTRTATGDDVAWITAPVTLTDTAAGSDMFGSPVPVTDSGTGSDSVTVTPLSSPPSPIQAAHNTGNTASATVTCSSTAAGNLLVFFIGTANNPGNNTFTMPAGWTQIQTTQNDNGFIGVTSAAWYYENNPGGITSVTCTINAAPSQWDAAFVEFANVATSSSMDGSAVAVSSGFESTHSVSDTTTVDGDLVVGFACLDAAHGGTPTITEGSGWTSEVQVADVGGWLALDISYQVQSTHGSVAYNPSWSTSTDGVFFIAGFKASAAKGATDTGSGTDNIAAVITLAVSDSAAGVDTPAVAVTFPLPDSGTLLETLAASVTAAIVDSGTGSENLSVNGSSAPTISDPASGHEALSATVQLAPLDTAAGVDAVTVVATFTQGDSGVGSESLPVHVTLTLSDAATGTDIQTVHVTLPVVDTAAGSDSLSLQPIVVHVVDTAAGVETIASTTVAHLTDPATGADSVTVLDTTTYQKSIGDSGTGGEVVTTTVVLLSAPTPLYAFFSDGLALEPCSQPSSSYNMFGPNTTPVILTDS